VVQVAASAMAVNLQPNRIILVYHDHQLCKANKGCSVVPAL